MRHPKQDWDAACFFDIHAKNRNLNIEKKYEELQARKAKEQRLRQQAWKKRMDAYRKKLAETDSAEEE